MTLLENSSGKLFRVSAKFMTICLVTALSVGGASMGLAGEISPSAVVGGKKLVLNGQATRTVWGFPVYHVGLFLEQGNREESSIMNKDRGAKRVQIKLVRSVDKDDFAAAVRDSINRNLSKRERDGFSGELASYGEYIKSCGDIEEGSTVNIDYVPNSGMTLSLNGKTLGFVAGHEFYHVMLRLWIGQPLQASIKTGLLAGG